MSGRTKWTPGTKVSDAHGDRWLVLEDGDLFARMRDGRVVRSSKVTAPMSLGNKDRDNSAAIARWTAKLNEGS